MKFQTQLSRRLAATLLVVAVFGLVAASKSFAQQGAQTATPATPEAKSYGLKLKGLDGKIYDVAEMRGEVVMVSFGATWCAPCVWELAAVEELREEYKDKPVRFLWVSIEDEEQTSDALLRHYAKSNRLKLPVLRDRAKETFAQFSKTVRIPLVVFFDKEGQYTPPLHRGMSSETTVYKQKMRERINALLRAGEEIEKQAGGQVKAAGAAN